MRESMLSGQSSDEIPPFALREEIEEGTMLAEMLRAAEDPENPARLLNPEVRKFVVEIFGKHNLEGVFRHHFERQEWTAAHTFRVTEGAADIASSLGIGGEKLEGLVLGAFLHDIGKSEVGADIVNKSERLTPDEQEKINKHPRFGVEIVEELLQKPEFASLLSHRDAISAVVGGHHEWQNDPYGAEVEVRDETVRQMVQIVAAADTFDALTIDRPYQRAVKERDEVERIMKKRLTVPRKLIDLAVSRFAEAKEEEGLPELVH